MSMRDRVAREACALLDEDPRTAIVLADISVSRFDEAAARHPGRVVNLGIREQLLIGATAGMALEGMRPIAHTYAPFLIERPFEQIKLDLTHQDLGAVLVSIGGSYDASKEGRTHQAPADVALLDTLAGWTVHVPGHADEAAALLRDAVAGTGRVYLRLSERQNAAPVTGKGLSVMRRGSDATVIAVGPMLDPVLEAAEGLDVTVLYAATVRPFDAATLLRTLAAPRVVVVEPMLEGTTAPHVSRALGHVPHTVLPIGVGKAEVRIYGTPADHDVAHGLDVAGIRARIAAFLAAAAA